MTYRFPEGARRPLFPFSPPTALEREILARQMSARRFDGSLVLSVVRRCRWGYPQVILCAPLGPKGPFPTSFWLTCPHLDRVCAALEAEGAVRGLESFLVSRYPEWVAFHEEQILLRLALLGGRGSFLRRFRPRLWEGFRGGVGGIRLQEKPHVKCLHLQVASWLGQGRHPGEAWLAGHLKRLDCDDPESHPCGGGPL